MIKWEDVANNYNWQESLSGPRGQAIKMMCEEIADLRNLRETTEILHTEYELHVQMLVKALQDIRDEEIMSGTPLAPVREYRNPLTASIRNIAIEALDAWKNK